MIYKNGAVITGLGRTAMNISRLNELINNAHILARVLVAHKGLTKDEQVICDSNLRSLIAGLYQELNESAADHERLPDNIKSDY